MADLKVVGVGLNPDDLWKNHFYLERRIQALEHKVRALERDLQEAREELWEFEADSDQVR